MLYIIITLTQHARTLTFITELNGNKQQSNYSHRRPKLAEIRCLSFLTRLSADFSCPRTANMKNKHLPLSPSTTAKDTFILELSS